jgi:hypothetical protein
MKNKRRATGKGAYHALREYERAGDDPSAWQDSADNLLRAAAVLAERREGCEPMSLAGLLRPVELMLKGIAIECLLKAAYVKRGNRLVEDGHYLGVRGASGHDLVQLARSAEVPMNRLETDLLRRLSHFVEYGGRYPIPKDASALFLRRGPTGGHAAALTWSTPGDGELFDALRERLNSILSPIPPGAL